MKGTLRVAGLPALLAITAGYVDAVAYLRLHVFVANITGTVVLTGIGAASGHIGTAGPGALAMAGFVGGIVLARLLARVGPSGLFVLSAVSIGADGLAMPAPAISILTLAAALGMQNTAKARFGGVGLNTAVLTGDLAHFAETIAPSGQGQRHRATARLVIGTVIVVYAGGAALGALASARIDQALLPSVVLLLAAAWITRRSRAD